MKTTLVVFIILGLAFSQIATKQSQQCQFQSLRVNNGDGQGNQKPNVTPAPWDGVYKSLKVTNDVTKPEEPPVPPPKVCPTLYKECYFKGDPIQLCDKIPKFDIKTIHSVWIPDGSRITLYEKSDFSGKSITFKETIPCIDKLNFS
ncbi:hypothetical protein ABPG72_004862 [Tetrahymena utriculariae]